MEPVSGLLVALFGAGGAGAVSGIIALIRLIRQGKVENEETLIKRLDADNKRHAERANNAEERADRAEREAEEYRRARDRAQDNAAILRRALIESGIPLPKLETERSRSDDDGS